MNRHVYASFGERRRDRHIGFLAFIVINVATWIAYALLRARAVELVNAAAAAAAKLPPGMGVYVVNPPIPVLIQLFPWLVNGVILGLGLIFRAEFASGYIACFGMILLACGALASIVVMSCVATVITALVLPPLAPLIFFGLALIGLFYFVRWAIPSFSEWWDTEPGSAANHDQTAE